MVADIGTKAPDFTLPDQALQAVTLSAELAKGKPVVLAFFPAAFTSVCQKELCTFRDRDQVAALNHLGKATVFGISIDTPFSLKEFGDQQKLDFQLLSDFNKDVIRAYDVVIPELVGLKGLAKRAVFVVGTDGVIKYKEVLEDARNEPNYDTLNAALAAL